MRGEEKREPENHGHGPCVIFFDVKSVCAALVLMVLTGQARAEVVKDKPSWGELASDAGIGALGGDVYTTFQVGFDLEEGAVSLGLQAVLRVMTHDRREGGAFRLRRTDWDEPSDFAHIIRYLTYRKQVSGLKIGLSIGELSPAGLGHETLVGNYHGVIDLDHPHSGIQLRLAHRHFDAHVLANDFVRPEILGFRVAVRPAPRLLGFELGFSGLWDFKAKTEVLLDGNGARLQTKTRYPEVETCVLGFVGGDVSYTWGHRKSFWVKPGVDLSHAISRGFGLEIQVAMGGRLFSSSFKLSGGAGYRYQWGQYLPTYVDLFYDVQRFQVPLGKHDTSRLAGLPTKLQVMDALRGSGHGGRFWGRLEWKDRLWVQAAYEVRDIHLGDTAFAEVGLPWGRLLVLSALVGRTGLLGKDSFAVADGLLSGAEVRVRVTRYLYLLGQMRYAYALNPEGIFEGLFLANLAVGGTWGYQ